MSAIKEIKHAFLFEGQGSQRPGMYVDLIAASEPAKAIFDRADQLCKEYGLNFTITEACSPDSDLLNPTKYQPLASQLSIVTGQLATIDHLYSCGVPYSEVNEGQSLGLISAARASRILPDFDTAFLLTLRRAQGMEKFDRAKETAVGVLADLRLQHTGLITKAEQIISSLGDSASGVEITVVNSAYNLLYGGPKEKVKVVSAAFRGAFPGILVKEKPNIPLSHHSLLEKAAMEFRQILELVRTRLADTTTPVISDITGEAITKVEGFVDAAGKQMVKRIIWNVSLDRLRALGITHAFEIGPGNTFSEMGKTECPEVEFYPTNNLVTINKAVSLFHPI